MLQMTNVLEQGSQWLSDQIDQYAASSVLYRRGSLTVPVQAGKGRTTFELTDTSGILISIESRDFLISAANLLLDDIPALPEVGDRIIETVGEELHAYEVSNFGAEQPYRFCDPFRHKLRVHTRYIGVIVSL
jgi:hypothetical protein